MFTIEADQTHEPHEREAAQAVEAALGQHPVGAQAHEGARRHEERPRDRGAGVDEKDQRERHARQSGVAEEHRRHQALADARLQPCQGHDRRELGDDHAHQQAHQQKAAAVTGSTPPAARRCVTLRPQAILWYARGSAAPWRVRAARPPRRRSPDVHAFIVSTDPCHGMRLAQTYDLRTRSTREAQEGNIRFTLNVRGPDAFTSQVRRQERRTTGSRSRSSWGADSRACPPRSSSIRGWATCSSSASQATSSRPRASAASSSPPRASGRAWSSCWATRAAAPSWRRSGAASPTGRSRATCARSSTACALRRGLLGQPYPRSRRRRQRGRARQHPRLGAQLRRGAGDPPGARAGRQPHDRGRQYSLETGVVDFFDGMPTTAERAGAQSQKPTDEPMNRRAREVAARRGAR